MKKNERGSISLYVLIAMIFFLFFAITVYIGISNSRTTQIKAQERIKEIYGQHSEDPEGMYSEIEDILVQLPVVRATPNTGAFMSDEPVYIRIDILTNIGLSASSVHEYQFGKSKINPPTGTWRHFDPGIPFLVTDAPSGMIYLWVNEGIRDTMGNVLGYKLVGIYIADYIAPKATIIDQTASDDLLSVAISVTGQDEAGGSGICKIVRPDGTEVTGNTINLTATYTATASGTYNFTLYDNAGNFRIVPIEVELDWIPIYTREQLAKIGNGQIISIEQEEGKKYKFLPGSKYKLKNDINMNGIAWNSIGSGTGLTSSNYFSGIFNGQNNSIIGLTINATNTVNGSSYGLFSNNNGIIYDLKLEDVDINVSGGSGVTGYIGGIVGTNTNQVINCSMVSGTVQVTTTGLSGTYVYAGGVVGYTHGISAKVENCQNSGTVIAESEIYKWNSYAGGIAGRSSSEGLVVGCKSTTTSEVIGNVHVGGIIGVTNNTNTVAIRETLVESCINEGKVTGDIYGIGGITGGLSLNHYRSGQGNGSVAPSRIKDCINYGEITGDAAVGGIAGVAGRFSSTVHDYNCFAYVENCENYGNIKTTEGNSAGGITGGSTGVSKILNCINYGNVTGEGIYTGGIAGYNSLRSSVEDCTNSGIIAGMSNSVGGIVGSSSNESEILNCTNSGDVTGEASYIGGVVGNNGSCIVEDCTNSGNVVGTNNGRVGGIAGNSGNESEILNCINSGDVTGEGTYVGGIAGRNYTESEILNCMNSGDVIGMSNRVGGIAGDQYGDAVISECENSGTVTGEGTYVGGIVGYQYTDCVISECENYADIKGEGAYVGGIAGRIQYNCEISDCINSGTVIGVENRVGGIAGDSANSSTDEYYNKILRCKNYGDITGEASYIGGIVGYQYYRGIVSECENYGDISGTVNQVAGIAGYSQYNSMVTDCINYGQAAGTASIGGIVGLNQNSSIVSDCINEADITGEGNFVGGIIGNQNNSIDVGVTNCTNSGNITGGYYVGGLIGGNGNTVNNMAISNCTNSGNITAGYYAGGMIGSYGSANVVDNLVISNCTNSGNVIGTGTNTTNNLSGVGGIIGYHNDTNGSLGQIINCINSGNITGTCNIDSAESAGTIYVGGITGRSRCGAGISGCSNTGTITANRATNGYVGGIIGYAYVNVNVNDCSNTGDVEMMGSGGTSGAGGISGYNDNASTSNCINEGTVISNAARLGGIVATLNGGNIINCENRGPRVEGISTVGGIAGYTLAIANSQITGCKNYAQTIATGSYVGGILGNNNGADCQVTDCINDAAVTAASYVGGVVGYNQNNNLKLTGCINDGMVTGTGSSVGGILGWDNVTTIPSPLSMISNCINNGNITGVNYVGGILGRNRDIDDYYTEIMKSYNTGAVKAISASGDTYAGGIMGWVRNMSSVNDCFNTGAVSADGTGAIACVGGIIGRTTTPGVNMVNCYNIGDVTSTGHTTLRLGALIGSISTGGPTASLQSSYFYRKTTNVPTVAVGYPTPGPTGGVELNVTTVKTQGSFSGWNFSTIWQIDAGSSSPYLRDLTKPASVVF